MPDMFCFQCQQTAGGTGCVRTGVCGKAAAHGAAAGCAHLRADPSGAGRAGGVTPHGGERPSADRRLFTTLTNVNFDDRAIHAFTQRAAAERRALGGADAPDFPLWKGETDIVSLRRRFCSG